MQTPSCGSVQGDIAGSSARLAYDPARAGTSRSGRREACKCTGRGHPLPLHCWLTRCACPLDSVESSTGHPRNGAKESQESSNARRAVLAVTCRTSLGRCSARRRGRLGLGVVTRARSHRVSRSCRDRAPDSLAIHAGFARTCRRERDSARRRCSQKQQRDRSRPRRIVA